MKGETNLDVLLKTMKPLLNEGDYVFCVATNKINTDEIIMSFKETEGTTIIIKKELADSLQLNYTFVAAWITLTVHSSLAAVGLTAAFSTALAKENISCNVVAALYHDNIFVNKKDAEKTMKVLENLHLKNY
jgi:uncharacterized protein